MLSRAALYRSLEGTDARAALVLDLRGVEVGLVHWWRVSENVYEVGGAVGDERRWGSGIGIEAAALIVDYLFEVRRCRRIEFTTSSGNQAVLNIGYSDSMLLEAICEQYFATPSGARPAVKSGLTRDEYERPYSHYQPRVGRHPAPGRPTVDTDDVRAWVDISGICESLGEAQ